MNSGCWGRWQTAIVVSYLVYVLGTFFGAWIDRQILVLILAIVILVFSVAFPLSIRKKKGWMLFVGVVLISFSAGLATQSIWLDKDALTDWVPDFLRLCWYGIGILGWTTMVRWLPWKWIGSILAASIFLLAIVLGIVWYRVADLAKEILYLGIFYLPVAIGSLLILRGEAMEDILLVSFFGALIVIVLIAIFVISQGEMLEGFDFGIGGTKRPKRPKR